MRKKPSDVRRVLEKAQEGDGALPDLEDGPVGVPEGRPIVQDPMMYETDSPFLAADLHSEKERNCRMRLRRDGTVKIVRCETHNVVWMNAAAVGTIALQTGIRMGSAIPKGGA